MKKLFKKTIELDIYFVADESEDIDNIGLSYLKSFYDIDYLSPVNNVITPGAVEVDNISQVPKKWHNRLLNGTADKDGNYLELREWFLRAFK